MELFEYLIYVPLALALKWPEVLNANLYVVSVINFSMPFYRGNWVQWRDDLAKMNII